MKTLNNRTVRYLKIGSNPSARPNWSKQFGRSEESFFANHGRWWMAFTPTWEGLPSKSIGHLERRLFRRAINYNISAPTNVFKLRHSLREIPKFRFHSKAVHKWVEGLTHHSQAQNKIHSRCKPQPKSMKSFREEESVSLNVRWSQFSAKFPLLSKTRRIGGPKVHNEKTWVLISKLKIKFWRKKFSKNV